MRMDFLCIQHCFSFRSNTLESKSNFSKFLLIANSIQLNFIEERKNDGGYNRNENILKIRFSLVYISLMTADSFPIILSQRKGKTSCLSL